MDPIYPWLDPIEVRHLADQLMRPVKQPAVSVTEAGFDDAFVGFASDPALVSATASTPVGHEARAALLETPPLTPQVTLAAPIEERLPVPPQAAVQEPVAETPEPHVPARGPFLERIQHFRDWMRHHFAATGIFILDREGAVIFDESNHGRLHFLARSLALASRRPGTTAGNVHVKIGAGTTLEVIPVETAYGCLVLGAVVPDSMDPTAVAAVMKALSEIASPHPGH
ncbi:MAG: hypothetical protein V4640_12325 [Verrucomicrobiota bacterium]